MFRLSNLVTALFGIIAALGAILGITSLGSVNRVASDLNGSSTSGTAPADSISPSDGTVSLTAPRQVGQNATSTGTPLVTKDSTGTTTAQNPTAEFFTQGEGAELSTEPTSPTTPSEAVAVQLDPSPGAVPATVSAPPAPVAQAREAAATVPAPAPASSSKPVRAMW